MNELSHNQQWAPRLLAMFRLAFRIFARIRGTEQAAAFAHYALFSFFPLLVLLVAVASVFVDRERAEAEIVAYVQTHIPIDQESHRFVTETINGVIATRGKAGGIAVLMLGWAASLFLTTLIRATNLAWGDEVSPWWRLRLKSMGGLPIIVLAALFVLFVIQNTRIVEVQLLFWTVSMSRSLMLLGTLLIGLIGGWLLGRAKKNNNE